MVERRAFQRSDRRAPHRGDWRRAPGLDRSGARDLLVMEGVEAVVRQTDDPEVVVTEITHHGWSKATNAPYRHLALGVIRVRDGQIVRYDDYMDPIAVARLLGRTSELAAALAAPNGP